MTIPWRKHPRWSAEQHWMIPNERMGPAVRAQLQAHRSRLGYFWKQTMQNKHSEQIERNYSGICQPPLRAFQQTCGFPEEWQRPSLHQQVSSNLTCDLKAKVNSLGTTPQNGPAYTKIHIYVFLRWFSPTLHYRGLYSNSVSTEQEPQIPAACMAAPSFLLQSALLTTLFSGALPPAVIYLEISRLAWRCKLHRSRGKQDRIQRKRTLESQPAMSPAPKQAVAQPLLLTDACS